MCSDPSGAPGAWGRDEERGSAILESTVAIAALLAVGAALLWALGLGICAAQAAFTAREAARSLARGEDSATVLARSQQSSPDADVVISGDGSTVTVTVERDFAPSGLLRGLGLTVRQAATAWRET